eukprot:COSAG01_NODE_2851_length_6937_cov_13.682228_1_plen_163_part_10
MIISYHVACNWLSCCHDSQSRTAQAHMQRLGCAGGGAGRPGERAGAGGGGGGARAGACWVPRHDNDIIMMRTVAVTEIHLRSSPTHLGAEQTTPDAGVGVGGVGTRHRLTAAGLGLSDGAAAAHGAARARGRGPRRRWDINNPLPPHTPSLWAVTKLAGQSLS